MPALHVVAIRTRRGDVTVWLFDTATEYAAALALLHLYGAEVLAEQPEDLVTDASEFAAYLREHHLITQ